MKKKLLKMLEGLEARKAEFVKKATDGTTLEEVRSANSEILRLNDEIAEMRSAIAESPDDPEPKAPTTGEDPKPGEARGAQQQPQGGFTPVATYSQAAQPKSEGNEKRGIEDVLKMPVSTPEQMTEMRQALFATPEYRMGYLKNLSGRTNIPDIEKRALTTAANSGGAAVPTVTYDLIVKRMQQVSALFNIIRKTNIPGNVVLPVANPQTAAQWTDEMPASDQDDTLSQVSLSSFALSKFARVKGQLLIMAIDAFESYVVEAIGDQLAIANENAILNATGAGQPTGILPGVTWDATNSLTWAKGSTVGYDNLVDAKALLGLYRVNAVWVMNSNMEAQIYKIKTTVNQPLFTQNPITGLISSPLGFPIVVDYYMPDNTILLFNPDYYYMNIQQNPVITSDDHAGYTTTSRLYRGTMFLDAKPALSAAFVKLSMATS